MKCAFLAAALTATLLIGSFGAASALPIKPIDPLSGSFSGTSPSGTSVTVSTPLPTDPFPTFADSNIDYFGFYIPFLGTYTITASVEATFFDNVTLTSFLLYGAQPDLLPGSPFAKAMYTTISPGKYIALDKITLAKGLYYLGVGASGTNPTPPSGYAGTLSKVLVSTVPLPASAPLFGAALLGLGAVGYGMKRRKAATAA